MNYLFLRICHLFEGFAFEGSMFFKAFGFYCFSFTFSLLEGFAFASGMFFEGFACHINHLHASPSIL